MGSIPQEAGGGAGGEVCGVRQLVAVDFVEGRLDLAAVRGGIVAEGGADRGALGGELGRERFRLRLPGALEAELFAAPLHEEGRALADRGEDRAQAQSQHEGEDQGLGRRGGDGGEFGFEGHGRTAWGPEFQR